jgi:hypothetical protein
MTLRELSRWYTAMAGMAGLLLVISPAVLAVEASVQGTVTGRPGHICSSWGNSTRQLAVIDNPGDDFFQCLGLTTDGDMIKTIHLETHGIAANGRHMAVNETEVTEFPRTVMESRRGAVLDGRPGHDAIVLRGRFPTAPGDMELIISYLYNGLTEDYRGCPIALHWTSGTGWRLVNRLGQPFSHIVIRTREVPIIGMIGIANLEGACPA